MIRIAKEMLEIRAKSGGIADVKGRLDLLLVVSFAVLAGRTSVCSFLFLPMAEGNEISAEFFSVQNTKAFSRTL
jgi:hypothetical protein